MGYIPIPRPETSLLVLWLLGHLSLCSSKRNCNNNLPLAQSFIYTTLIRSFQVILLSSPAGHSGVVRRQYNGITRILQTFMRLYKTISPRKSEHSNHYNWPRCRQRFSHLTLLSPRLLINIYLDWLSLWASRPSCSTPWWWVTVSG